MISEDWTSLPVVDAVREIAADDKDYTLTKMFQALVIVLFHKLNL